jgi:hypothetical protein
MVYSETYERNIMDDLLNYKKAFVIEDLLKTNPRAAKLLAAKTIEEFDQLSDAFRKEDFEKMSRFKLL